VDELARILLHVRPGDADGFFSAVHLNLNFAVFGNRQFELRNLISLGQVGIEVIFSGKLIALVDSEIAGQRQLDGVMDNLPVQHGQGPGHAETDRAGMGIGRRAECGGAAAENFTLSLHLGMDFQADYSFKFHDIFVLVNLLLQALSGPFANFKQLVRPLIGGTDIDK